MAIEIPVGAFSLKTVTTLAAKQYRFAKLSADMTVAVCASSLDAAVGVIQNAPVTNDAASLLNLGVSKVVLGAAATVGDYIGTDANGAAVPIVIGTDTTKYVLGRALETGGSGAIISIALAGPAPGRAA